MARVYCRKAAKDYPASGIAKGEEYYYCKRKTGPRSSQVIRQKNSIQRWQLTSSEYLSTLWQLQDGFEASSEGCEAAVEVLRELSEQQAERLEAMPQSLQEGDTGQLLSERGSSCEEAANELESIASEWEGLTMVAEPNEHEFDMDDQADVERYQEMQEVFEEYEQARDELVQRASDAIGGVE